MTEKGGSDCLLESGVGKDCDIRRRSTRSKEIKRTIDCESFFRNMNDKTVGVDGKDKN